MGKTIIMYLAYDGINADHENFDTLEEAQKYLEEVFLDEGYDPEMVSCKIYKLVQKVSFDVVAKKTDFTDEEWEEEGYSDEFDEMWKHKFIECGEEKESTKESGLHLNSVVKVEQSETPVICPFCNGEGGFQFSSNPDDGEICSACKGKG